MPTVGQIARRFGPLYAARYGERMLPSHRRTLADLAACRTATMGGRTYECADCGGEHYAYLSCKNRHCSTCSKVEREQWIAKRQTEMLPVPYWHVTFTLPSELREVCRQRQRVVYGILMRTAAQALIELAKDPRFVGAKVAVMVVLHTWRRDMLFHPHVHVLVSGGGVDADGRWRDPKNPKFLVPQRALSDLFRGKFMAELKAELPDCKVSPKVWDKRWVVDCKKVQCTKAMIVEYLGRYVHRVAISNNRILEVNDETVTYSYKPNKGSWSTAEVTGEEFLRRFLQHVLPSGFCKVRYYGLWHPSNRKKLNLAQAQLVLAGRGPIHLESPADATSSGESAKEVRRKPQTCRHCGSTEIYAVKGLPRQRPPPWLRHLRFPHNHPLAP